MTEQQTSPQERELGTQTSQTHAEQVDTLPAPSAGFVHGVMERVRFEAQLRLLGGKSLTNRRTMD